MCAFTELLQANAIQISMDGRVCCLDNIFIERLWHSLTCEDVYLTAMNQVETLVLA